jgi:hypothetical protein
MISILDIFKFIVLLTGIIDAEKYENQRSKIIKARTAKSQSRMFLNKAFVIDVIKLAYVIVLYPHDWVLLTISFLPLITIARCYWVTYLYYPYKMRGLPNFTRPNFLTYFCNSWISNKKRKRL